MTYYDYVTTSVELQFEGKDHNLEVMVVLPVGPEFDVQEITTINHSVLILAIQLTKNI